MWRVFGALAIAYVVLLLLPIAGSGATPEIGSPRSEIQKHLMTGSMPGKFAGGYEQALSAFVFLMAALLLARLLRGATEWTGWLSSMISATAIISAASTLTVGSAAGAAAIYDGHHGAPVETVTMLNDVRNFAFFLSIADLGVFTACAGAAILATRAMPRLLGWSGVGSGALCLVAVAGARNGTHDIANLVQCVWWVSLAVVAIRRPSGERAGQVSRDTVPV
jgi:hypothetical protein